MKVLVVDDEQDMKLQFVQPFRKEIRSRDMGSGAKDFFTKPIDFERLRKEVHHRTDQGGMA